jgi:hypothetical protein
VLDERLLAEANKTKPEPAADRVEESQTHPNGEQAKVRRAEPKTSDSLPKQRKVSGKSLPSNLLNESHQSHLAQTLSSHARQTELLNPNPLSGNTMGTHASSPHEKWGNPPNPFGRTAIVSRIAKPPQSPSTIPPTANALGTSSLDMSRAKNVGSGSIGGPVPPNVQRGNSLSGTGLKRTF